MSSFGRYIQVTLIRERIQLPTGVTVAGVDTNVATDIEERKLSHELKCTFSFKSDGSKWDGTVKVYNLSDSSRQFPFGGINGLKGSDIQIDAGYAENHAVIMRSSITEINEYVEGVDSVTEYKFKGVSSRFRNATYSISMDKEVAHYDMIIKALDDNHIDYVDEVAFDIQKSWTKSGGIWQASGELNRSQLGGVNLKIARQFVFHGTLEDMIRSNLYGATIVRPYEAYQMDYDLTSADRESGDTAPRKIWAMRYGTSTMGYYTDNKGVGHLHWADDANKKTDVIKISPETGITSVPRKSSKSKKTVIKLNHILIPELRRGSIVDVTTSGKYHDLTDGRYIIKGAKFSGSNYGGKHEVSMELIDEPTS